MVLMMMTITIIILRAIIIIIIIIIRIVKVKVQLTPRTGHEGPEREQMYSSTLPSSSALDEVGGQRQARSALPPPPEKPVIHCIGG